MGGLGGGGGGVKKHIVILLLFGEGECLNFTGFSFEYQSVSSFSFREWCT